MKRNETLDALKGVLILLVILGHILHGGTLTSYIEDAIYSFHMPLFLGISGYFLKQELFYSGFASLSKKYFYRLIIPFSFAYLVYCFIKADILSLLYPFFHLWFIPAFLLFLIYLYLIERSKIHLGLILIILFIASVMWTGTYGFSADVKDFHFIGDKRFYYDFVFLFFGYYLRNTPKKFDTNWLFPSIIFTCSAFYILILHSKSEINFIYSTTWVIFNLLLIYLALRLANIFSSVRLPYINAIGIASLPIYLWHILPLLVLRTLFEKYTLNGYIDYVIYFVGVAIVIGLIFQLKKTALGKVILFGEKLSRSAGK